MGVAYNSFRSNNDGLLVSISRRMLPNIAVISPITIAIEAEKPSAMVRSVAIIAKSDVPNASRYSNSL